MVKVSNNLTFDSFNFKMNKNTKIPRNILTQDQLQRTSFVNADISGVSGESRSKKLKVFCLKSFPIIEWLSEYSFKKDLPMDFIAGCTVTILVVPQGLAYAMLANVPPVCGIYTGFYPVFMYVIFGCSRHLNIGSFAVVCLMVGQIILRYTSLDKDGKELDDHLPISETGGLYKDVEVLSAVTFTVSIQLLFMYIFRLGIITAILSKTLLNAFTSACAIHLICSQFKDFFAVKFKQRKNEFFVIGYTVYDVSRKISSVNLISIGMAIGSLIVSILYQELLRPWMSRKCRFPLPVEMMLVSLGTFLSYWFDLNLKYDVPIIGEIPKGFASVLMPEFVLMKNIFFDCIPIALTSFIVTISFGFIFATKGSYEIRPNQELLALGLMDLIGCFFQCYPVSTSMSRTFVLYQAGCQSQIANAISAIILLLIMLYIGPVLEYAPKSILAAIIISAIYKLLFQIKELKIFWLLSKLDAMIWIATFLGTVIIDIKYGLLLGLGSAILVICYRFCNNQSYLLGNVPNTEIYLARHRYKQIEELDNIKIFRFEGGINFASKEIFKQHLADRTGINAKQIQIDYKRALRRLEPGQEPQKIEIPAKCIIIDFSAITHIDPAGAISLRNLEKSYQNIGVTILICCASAEIAATLNKFDKVEKTDHSYTFFVTIHDAVLYAREFLDC